MLYRKVIGVCSENHKKHQVGKIYDFSTLDRVTYRPIITTKFRDIFSFTDTFTGENNSHFMQESFKGYILASDAHSFAIPKY
jgi:hypothetical protein